MAGTPVVTVLRARNDSELRSPKHPICGALEITDAVLPKNTIPPKSRHGSHSDVAG
jgi:hypothetical protein